MKNQIKIEYFKTAYGELILGSYKNKLCLCDWRYRNKRNAIDKRISRSLNADFVLEKSSIIEKTKIQLIEYFDNERKKFEIPILLIGTEFQKSVWKALSEIPFGKTISYSELANNLNNIKAIRGIANANGANSISIIVPCHRIIGKNGDLVGYAGGLVAKKKLLHLEGALVNNQLEFFS